MTEMKFLWPVNTTGNSPNLCRALVCVEILHVEDVLPSFSKWVSWTCSRLILMIPWYLQKRGYFHHYYSYAITAIRWADSEVWSNFQERNLSWHFVICSFCGKNLKNWYALRDKRIGPYKYSAGYATVLTLVFRAWASYAGLPWSMNDYFEPGQLAYNMRNEYMPFSWRIWWRVRRHFCISNCTLNYFKVETKF